MARETLDRKLAELKDEILILDSMVEQATLEAIQALMTQDVATAEKIYAEDQQINRRRFILEEDCMITIATQQPIMAKDLRLVASILEVVGEMERMGDYAKGIAKITILLGKNPPIRPLADIPRMADLVISMLHRAVEAFINYDHAAALRIPSEDDRVDEYYNKIYRDLVSQMLVKPGVIDEANHLMWAAHNLERMADRVTNICERTIYIATGELREVDESDDEHRK